MEKRRTLFVVPLLVAMLGFSFANDPGGNRIKNAEGLFSAMLALDPAKEVEATLYFSETLPWQRVREFVRPSKVDVRAFRFGNSIYSGGYSFKAGETIDTGFQRFREAHEAVLLRFLGNIENRRRAITSFGPADPGKIRSLDDEKQTLDTMLNGLRSGGEIIAIIVRGSLSEIAHMKNKSQLISVVEMTTTRFGSPAILPGGSPK